MKIGKGRRVTLPKQLLAAAAAAPGDYLQLDLEKGSFSIQKVSEKTAVGEDEEMQQLREEMGGVAATADIAKAQIITEREPGHGQPAYQADIERTKRLVAQYFGGLGVAPDVLEKELSRLSADEKTEPTEADQSDSAENNVSPDEGGLTGGR